MTQKAVTTTALADAIGIKPESIRSHISRKGEYYGVVPQKLPNGRLIWPEDSLERIMNRGARNG